MIINDWSRLRSIMLISGVIILVIDIFLGTITYVELAKIGKRIAGMKA